MVRFSRSHEGDLFPPWVELTNAPLLLGDTPALILPDDAQGAAFIGNELWVSSFDVTSRQTLPARP